MCKRTGCTAKPVVSGKKSAGTPNASPACCLVAVVKSRRTAYRVKDLPQGVDLAPDRLRWWWPCIWPCLIQLVEARGCWELAESLRLLGLLWLSGGIHGLIYGFLFRFRHAVMGYLATC